MLLDERPLVLLPSLAQAVGVNEAVVIQQLHFHLANPDNGREHDGEQWIYKSYDDWQATDFWFWSTRTIRRLLCSLEKKGWILSCQPEGRASRRKYYRLDYAELEKIPRARAQQAAKSGASKRPKVALPLIRDDLTETTKKSTRHALRSLRSAPLHDAFIFEGDEMLTDEQRDAVRYFNEKLPAHGFLPVTEISPELEKVLEVFDAESIRDLVDWAANGDGDCIPDGSKTLVRLCWTNY